MKSLIVNKTLPLLALWFLLAALPLAAEEPVFVADLPNPNDFSLFANGGWDGNWYVGYDTCWVQKLTVPPGKYAKAYIGAKLGRMKSLQVRGKAPWEKKAIPGKIFMAVSSTVSWEKSQSVLLTKTSDIPLEPDIDSAVEGVGESRWFWKEVPLKLITPGQDHYLALWSPTKWMDSISSSAVLAAGWGNADHNSWFNNDVRGSPPKNANQALSNAVTIFEPALALKLIPECRENSQDCPKPPRVKISKIEDSKRRGKGPASKVVWANILGNSVDRAWVEISPNKKKWVKLDRFVWSPPYAFTVPIDQLPLGRGGKMWVRVSAADVFENESSSEPQDLLVNTIK